MNGDKWKCKRDIFSDSIKKDEILEEKDGWLRKNKERIGSVRSTYTKAFFEKIKEVK